jgi:hypothetical protein
MMVMAVAVAVVMMMVMARPHGDDLLVVVILVCGDCSEAHLASLFAFPP